MRVLFCEASGEPASMDEWMTGMSPEKRARVLRMRKRKDVWTAVTAHRLLCYALIASTGSVPSAQDWGAGEHGKPYLTNFNGIHFNISHSGSMAMCAVSDSPVGADVEQIKPYSDAVAKRIMSDEERRFYLCSPDKQTLFFQIWTLKESYLKYTGAGLTALKSVTVRPSENGVSANVPGRFSLIGLPGYQAAVCSDSADFSAEHVGLNALAKL